MNKTIKKISIKLILIILYSITLILCLFTPNQFIGIAFDISGATTGDLSTPFILTLGVGIAKTVSAKHKSEEQFGIIGIASVTPLIAFLAFGLIKGNTDPEKLAVVGNGDKAFHSIIQGNLWDVFWAILPVVGTFILYNSFYVKMSRKSLKKLLLFSGVVYIGLVIFLSGVDYGFTIAGRHIGRHLSTMKRSFSVWSACPVHGSNGTCCPLPLFYASSSLSVNLPSRCWSGRWRT
jgi:hypothetical protein